MNAKKDNQLENELNEELEAEFEKDEKIVWESLARKEVPVEIEGEEYVLVEASAEEARQWRANNFQSLQTTERGKGKNRESATIFTANIARSHIILVSLCLFKVEPNGRRRVSTDVISGWPNALVEMLFKRAQKISGLRDEDDEQDDKDGDEDNSGNSSQKKRLGAK